MKIESGRPHQIRIHSAYAGHPLLNDPLYGPHCAILTTQFADEEDLNEEDAPSGTRSAVPSDIGYDLHSWVIFNQDPSRPEMSLVVKATPPISFGRDYITSINFESLSPDNCF